jgi:hypothetical protein
MQLAVKMIGQVYKLGFRRYEHELVESDIYLDQWIDHRRLGYMQLTVSADIDISHNRHRSKVQEDIYVKSMESA